MDNLEAVLRDLAESENGMIGTWNMRNNGVVIAIDATSKAAFGSAVEAFHEAGVILQALTGDGVYAVVNRASIGVSCEPLNTEDSLWRGTLDVCLRRADQLEDHELIEITT